MNRDPSLQLTLAGLAKGEPLNRHQARAAFELIMTGQATDAQIGALLAAMQVRPGGPTVDEITGAAQVMREKLLPVAVPEGVEPIDTCGTGGVGGVTFNVSTTAAIIAAGAGAYVAKHGNRSVTSRSGSSQVLQALGVKLDVPVATVERCIAEARIGFCFAPAHHPAMKYAIGPRKELGFRTIFNLLGPLTNPAGARRQLIGTVSPTVADQLAHVLANLGAKRAMVVHGDGQDDIATTGETYIAHVDNGQVTSQTITPEQFGLARAKLGDLMIDGVEASAQAVRRVLDCESGPRRDIAALNAAGALVVAGLADDLVDALAKAQQSLDTGAAKATLQKLVDVTQAAAS